MHKVLLAVVLTVMGLSSAAMAEGLRIGVSWADFQEPRWKFDAAAMRSAIQGDGNKYITTNAEGSSEKQLADIYDMVTKGLDALIIHPVDKEAIAPALDWAEQAGIPVIAYDRLIEDQRVFYLTFDNIGVGRIIAAVVRQAQPEGNYVIIKGDPGDANTTFLRQGMEEVIGAAVTGGSITIVGEAFVDGWKPDAARETMARILAENGDDVDAVLVQNDGMAGGVAEALEARGMNVPIGGQDGDPGAINRVALGTQTVSVWKNNRELGKAAGKIAGLLAAGSTMDRVPGSVLFSGGDKGIALRAILLNPTPITRDNVYLAIDADHVSQRDACKGVTTAVRGCE
jgi:D-xylose transport system substrate-binding protein